MIEEHYQIIYEFNFKNGTQKSFQILIDPQTISYSLPELKNKPDWTRLDYQQCDFCELTPDEHPRCPVALNIAELVEEFKETVSIEDCMVRCITPERTYLKETNVQEGLYSIFGIINATSSCPTMSFLKPMARFHLPFATTQESMARTISFYLLRQYFEYKKGNIPDLELKQLDEHYQRVTKLDKRMLERIQNASPKDADKNAFITLNSLAQLISMEIDDNLNSLEYLFNI